MRGAEPSWYTGPGGGSCLNREEDMVLSLIPPPPHSASPGEPDKAHLTHSRSYLCASGGGGCTVEAGP